MRSYLPLDFSALDNMQTQETAGRTRSRFHVLTEFFQLAYAQEIVVKMSIA